MEGFILSKTLSYNQSCEAFASAKETKSISTTIDFREVERVTVGSVRGKFLFRFALDYDGPGMLFIAKDHLENGAEGSFKRYAEVDRLALETAKLTSGQKYLNCDSKIQDSPASASIAFWVDKEPNEWIRLVEKAMQCRGDDTFEFVNNFSKN
ncbi:hypothetical protein [Amylibacter sp. IMCC11727]|uniref:hypothetical protein n=1 Tax=Amylibacter sp. IMCC11727 TaxID=3039851 RepID=UPI00244DFF84|nr:hypothetical protein [Amylibacter sp. IMCC11727]WGI21027.1 hypothetical protein QBD29_13045 [Amylibacter sp. IMCC11727]